MAMQDTVRNSPGRRDVAVDFNEDPKDSLSRPLNTEESWACYHFEVHARKCVYCHNSFEVHRIHEQLCEVGHTLAQSVARCLYRESDGSTYSTVEEDNELVRIEIPTGYVEVCSLLKAIERSIRHHYLMPFVSMDPSYYTVPKEGHPAPEESSADQVELDSSNFPADQISTLPIPSLASAANGVLKGSGSSAEKIDAATWELRSIFRDHEILRPLYTTVIHGAIGRQTFVNAFRRLLIEFARRLKDETQDRSGFFAARLVVWMAWEISEEVLERSQSAKARLDKRDDSGYISAGESSFDEDEQGETHEGESSLETLTNMREVLMTSTAFKLLKEDMKNLISSKRQPKESSSEPENEIDSEEGTNRSNIPLRPSFQTDAHAGPTESTIISNYSTILEWDRWMIDIYQHALAELGKDRFIIEYSKLLRHHHSNAHAPPDSEVDRSKGGSIDEQLMTTWQPIASAITQYLEDVDTISSYKWNKKFRANADKIAVLDRLPREEIAPYYDLTTDLALLALRGPLRQLLSHIPRCAIDFSFRNDTSFFNRTKAFLEDYTMVEWDWWPLNPRVPDVAYKESRLQWKFGGDQLYEILSSDESYIIQYAMSSLPDHPKQCFCCHIERPGKTTSPTAPQSLNHIATPRIGQRRWGLPVTWIKAAVGRASNPSNSSKAGQRYTPMTSSTTSTPVTSPPVAGGTSTSPSAMNTGNSAPQVSGQPTTDPSTAVPTPSSRVLFGVQGSRWSLEIEQIDITAALNDPAFFRELKIRYKKHRNWIKRLISPFRFRFCRFVKLEKFDAGRVLSQGDGLPDYPKFENDYEYAPKPGTVPMISPKTFAVCLKACDMNCKWPLVNPWHDCVSLPCRPYRLNCIPKKKSEFDIRSDAIAVAWGLEADHAISFAFMAVYHLVPLLAAFGFWIYWLIKFPGDWQNAAVPVLTVLAIFAVLWVPFGKHLGTV